MLFDWFILLIVLKCIGAYTRVKLNWIQYSSFDSDDYYDELLIAFSCEIFKGFSNIRGCFL